MTDSQASQSFGGSEQDSEMPDAYVAQVHELLSHLYDLPHLQDLQFIKQRGVIQERSLRTTALAVKQEVLELIETLNPGHSFYFRAPEARAYNIVLLHYVERYTVQKAADELGISERQAYRELRQAETSLAQLMWQQQQERSRSLTVPGSTAQHIQAGAAEIADVRDLLFAAFEVLRPLATASNVTLRLVSPQQANPVALNIPVARQVLIHLLSRAVKTTKETVTVELINTDAQFQITIQCSPQISIADDSLQPDTVIQPLIEQLGWRVQPTASGVSLFLPMPSLQKMILCIDDDPGFSELLRRYVTGLPVQIVSAATGEQGIEQAIQMAPDLIVLDVMMAGLDGWETLQHLRTHRSTRHLPVVICSVFHDPELAKSLGAADILPKPLAPAAFTQLLQTLGVL